MADFKVRILQDFHGVDKAAEGHFDEILKYLCRPDEKVLLLHEALTSSTDSRAEELYNGKMTQKDFLEYAFESWGPHESYRVLLDLVTQKTMALKGLDHTGYEREQLCQKYGLLARYLALLEKLGSAVKDLGDVDPTPLFNDYRYSLVWDREKGFCKKVDRAKASGFTTVFVATAPSHAKKIHPFLKGSGYDAEIVSIDQKIEEEMDAEERRVQMEYARENKVDRMSFPPLVPIVFKVFDEMDKYKKRTATNS